MNHAIIKKAKPLNSIVSRSLFFSNLTSEKGSSFPSVISEKIASSLQNCYEIPLLKQLHACMFTYGLQDNIFLGSKLLNSYAKFGFLSESRWVFNRIINNNLSLWNSIIVGYFRAGDFDEVFRVYSDLRVRKIGIHSSAITFSIKSCIELGDLELGSSIHVDAVKFGLNTDAFVGTSLIGLYFRYGDIDDASKVFDEMSEKDLVAYTSMITGYAQTGDHHAYEAFRIACWMQKEELDPNRVTLVSLLQAAAHLQALEYGQSVHGYAIRRCIGCSEEVFETSLMDMYLKCGSANKAAAIFYNMSNRTVTSWNALISGYLQLGKPLEALHSFFCMVRENLEPDLITLANGILSCADLELLREGKSIHGYILRSGIKLDVVATTALIDLYSKCNKTTTARKIFDRVEEKDVILSSVMIAGLLQNGFVIEVVETFCEMVLLDIKPNPSTILTITTAFAELGDIKQGNCIHGFVIKTGFESNTDIANQFLYMYAKCGFINSARLIFNKINCKDLASWTSMMMGYVNNGDPHEAIILFRLMQSGGLNPDSITLICLLQAFTQLGYLTLVKEVHCYVYRVSMEKEIPVINSLLTTYSKCGKLHIAKDLFEHMDRRALASWNTMIAAYGMHGYCHKALELFDHMKKKKISPDELTFTSVLSACSHSGLVEEGLRVFRSMKEEYSIIPCEEHYGCMVDLLSRSGQIEEAYNLVKSVPSKYCASALGALLAACRVHGDTIMGEVIGRWLLEIEPQNASAYGLVSNLYAEGEKWEDVAQIRAIAQGRGLRRTTGYSMVDID